MKKTIKEKRYYFVDESGDPIFYDHSVQAQTPNGEPCLQVIDYVNWAIQRVYTKKEMRFLSVIEDKVKYLVDIYDFDKYPNNFYSKINKFSINKISPL